MLVAGRMLLGYEKSIKVPKAGLNISREVREEFSSKSAAYLLVGISSKPISKKICRNSCRTLFTADLESARLASLSGYMSGRLPYKGAKLHFQLEHPKT